MKHTFPTGLSSDLRPLEHRPGGRRTRPGARERHARCMGGGPRVIGRTAQHRDAQHPCRPRRALPLHRPIGAARRRSRRAPPLGRHRLRTHHRPHRAPDPHPAPRRRGPRVGLDRPRRRTRSPPRAALPTLPAVLHKPRGPKPDTSACTPPAPHPPPHPPPPHPTTHTPPPTPPPPHARRTTHPAPHPAARGHYTHRQTPSDGRRTAVANRPGCRPDTRPTTRHTMPHTR